MVGLIPLNIAIYGAGGHGGVVAEAAQLRWPQADIVYVDDKKQGVASDDRPILPFDGLPDNCAIALGIGRNCSRVAATERVLQLGHNLLVVAHPEASISPTSSFGPATYIGPRAIIHSQSEIGTAVIINSGAIVEHDCTIGDFAHIGPGAILAGGVRVGPRSLIGIGARVLPGITIGTESAIGAGAIVTSDVPDGVTVAGIPARIIKDASDRPTTGLIDPSY
ncbi:MAG: NeuD/PglB/VioB family sugar acetyltransferase [Phycisphaeraceae bacterium]